MNETTTDLTTDQKSHVPVDSTTYSIIRCPRLRKTQRSGHGLRTYSNRAWMAIEQSKRVKEQKWATFNFSKLNFTGGFEHDSKGKLTARGVKNLKSFLVQLEQEDCHKYLLSKRPLQNPFRGLHSTLLGGSTCSFRLIEPFEVLSDEHLSEMVELYLMNEIEATSFISYTPETLTDVIADLTKVQDGLAYTARLPTETWTPENVFHCMKLPYQQPYLSQFWLYNKNNAAAKRKMPTIPGHNQHSPSKWGFSQGQAASLVSGKVQENGMEGPVTVPPENLSLVFEKYIHTGFHLGFIGSKINVHQLLLDTLNHLSNCESQLPLVDHFETTQTNLGFVLDQAKTVSSYWQWFVYRRQTPIETGLEIHNRVSSNEGLPEWFLQFVSFLDRVSERNDDYLSFYPNQSFVSGTVEADDSHSFMSPMYTLAVTNRSGYCDEPAYPNTAAVQAGAGITFIKFMLKTDVPYKQINCNIFNKQLFPTKDLIEGPVDVPVLAEPEVDGNTLLATELTDDRTIMDELHKFAENIAMSQCWAGKATSSDVHEGLLLGEQIGLRICSDYLSSWFFDHSTADGLVSPTVSIQLLDGTTQQIIASSAYRNK